MANNETEVWVQMGVPFQQDRTETGPPASPMTVIICRGQQPGGQVCGAQISALDYYTMGGLTWTTGPAGFQSCSRGGVESRCCRIQVY